MRCRRPVEYVADDRVECRNCGGALVGIGPTLRHLGESVAAVVPEPGDARSFDRAIEVAEAVARALPASATEDEVARAVAQALYVEGLLRRNRGPRRGGFLPVENDREPDYAERAAGEKIPA